MDLLVRCALVCLLPFSLCSDGGGLSADMELASRGQVFVGNGFSSFSSTVVRLRMVRGVAMGDTRLW